MLHSPAPQSVSLNPKQQRERAVNFALRFTEGTPFAPSCYERQLLEEFIQGTLTIDQVIALVDKATPA